MLDYLFIGAHSDDCEILAGGTMLYLKSIGQKVGILDLTAGELGSLGSPEKRQKEAEQAKAFLNLDYRNILDIEDGNVTANKENTLKIVQVLRETQAKIIVTFFKNCRHPDHSTTHDLVRRAFFLSGLKKVLPHIPTFKPFNLLYFKDFPFTPIPHFVIDISDFYTKKLELIKIYSSQVKTDVHQQDKTFIHSSSFWQVLEGTNLYHGSLIGATYGEGFFSENLPKAINPLENFKRDFV